MRRRLGFLSLAGLGVLVVLDVALVYLAFQHTAAPPAGNALAQPRASAEATETASAVNRTGGDAGRSSGKPGPPSVEPVETLISLAPDGTLVRATTGPCGPDAVPTVEISPDRGRTFEPATVATDLAAVLRVEAREDTVWLVGADTKCRVQTYTTQDGGETWEEDAGSAGAWHLPPDPATSGIHAPSGPVDTPCAPLSLAPVDAGVARVLCDGGTVLGTADGGASWVALGALDGAASIAYTSPGDGYALAKTDDCRAAVMGTHDGGASWEELKCFRRGTPLAVAADADLVAAQTGRMLHVSDDDGATWHTTNRHRPARGNAG